MAQSTSNPFSMTISDLAQFVGESSEQVWLALKKLFPVKQLYRGSLLPEQVRSYMLSRGYQYPKQVISIQMLKGGVAKTTTGYNLALRCHMLGARVLVIDLDQQANLSFSFGIDNPDLSVWVDIIEKRVDIQSAIIEIAPGLGLVPSSLNNSILDRVLVTGARNLQTAVKSHIDRVSDQYDIVFIDTAPNISATNTSATCASDMVLLPVNPDKFSLIGLKKNLEELAEIKSEYNLNFIEKILFTKFDARETASHELLENCIQNYTTKMLKSYIRTSVDVKNMIRAQKTIFDYKNNAKEDYDLVTRELMSFL